GPGHGADDRQPDRAPGPRAVVMARGHRRGSVTHKAPGALAAAAVALLGCRRGSRNLRDAGSPGQARSSRRRTARPSPSAREADMTEFVAVPGGRIACEVTGGGPLVVLRRPA